MMRMLELVGRFASCKASFGLLVYRRIGVEMGREVEVVKWVVFL